MADYRIVQKQSGQLTYILNLANRLAKAYDQAVTPVTISSVAVAAQPTPAVASAVAVAPINGVAGMGITVHLVTALATPNTSPEPLLTVNATLSNGDVDPIEITIGVTT